MMSHEEALQYIVYLEKHRRPEPAPEMERKFLQMFDHSTNVFSDTYGYYAAKAAEEWYESNKWRDITLGECVRAANKGLLLASYESLRREDIEGFRQFAILYIRDIREELASLKAP